jgi:hypothetical protein
MRLALLLLFAFIPALFADSPVVIKDSEAANHIGETVEVRGTVVSVHTSSAFCFSWLFQHVRRNSFEMIIPIVLTVLNRKRIILTSVGAGRGLVC